jgi:hypothetical protein
LVFLSLIRLEGEKISKGNKNKRKKKENNSEINEYPKKRRVKAAIK